MRTLAIIGSIFLAACQVAPRPHGIAASGVEVVLAAPEAALTAEPGVFVIRGLDTAHSARVPLAAKSTSTRHRLALPPGLYGVSFVPTLGAASPSRTTGPEPEPQPALRVASTAPSVFVVARGAFTPLHVRFETRPTAVSVLENTAPCPSSY